MNLINQLFHVNENIQQKEEELIRRSHYNDPKLNNDSDHSDHSDHNNNHNDHNDHNDLITNSNSYSKDTVYGSFDPQIPENKEVQLLDVNAHRDN